jgi:hypothetical protein
MARVSSLEYTKFKQFVRENKKEGLKHGDYKEELDKAMALYMKFNNSSTHTQTQNLNLKADSNTPKRVINVRDKIIKYLSNDHNLEGIGIVPVRVHINLLKKAIAFATNAKGEDRTIIPWIQKFEEYSILHEVQTSVYEFSINDKDGEDLKKAAKQKQIQDEIDSAFKY